MGLLVVGLVAVGWLFVFVVVIAFCKAASHSDSAAERNGGSPTERATSSQPHAEADRVPACAAASAHRTEPER